ncbi:hypothetical protein EJ05DRAFT_145356 [Pseudovirgaria hyperparasitica]|uniref:Uncharacterized protein n=1 Tax=Pseudovirgaria hyperparasitica TaxID=470096 RepID=A0A6A6VWF7_9PEZI|nr:uncharacterized protein EJ05DRAFT_145356 [Pseudovirgaria hyperparasitica]KAF2754583.1 hypothetical protein EJ05DRAFT_145356 [Pseudovirgaria hyperparasitica]
MQKLKTPSSLLPPAGGRNNCNYRDKYDPILLLPLLLLPLPPLLLLPLLLRADLHIFHTDTPPFFLPGYISRCLHRRDFLTVMYVCLFVCLFVYACMRVCVRVRCCGACMSCWASELSDDEWPRPARRAV